MLDAHPRVVKKPQPGLQRLIGSETQPCSLESHMDFLLYHIKELDVVNNSK